MKPNKNVLRILDANFNRSREGLRVCEEIFRFFLNEAPLMRRLKKSRHRITSVLKSLPVSSGALLAARDVRGDEGKKACRLEKSRGGLPDLFSANIERAKESLRVLEEFTKLLDLKASSDLKKLRFEVYAIEKKALPKLEALRDHGSGGISKAAARGDRARSAGRRRGRRTAA